MSMRAFILAVTGFALSVAACSSYGTSVVAIDNNTPTKVASVSITLPLSLAAGQSARAVAVPRDANGSPLTGRAVNWFSSSASIATVSDSGLILAVAPGTAVVSAVSEGVSGQASMAVTPPTPTPIATVTVLLSPAAIVIGQTAHATATLSDSSGKQITGRTVSWQSSNQTVATVSQAGDVSALGAGTAMISATSDGKSASSALSVSAPAPVPVASVAVSPAAVSVQVGNSSQLSAVTKDANNNVLSGRVVAWSSSNTAIATVSGSGLVSAVAAGSATITASSEGQSGTAGVTVTAPPPPPPPTVASISVSPSTSSIQTGATVQLSAVARDASGNTISGQTFSWASSNNSVATVSSSGRVTAVAAGTANVSATIGSVSGSASITVTAPPPPPPPPTVSSIAVSPSSSSIQTGATVQLSAVARDASGNTISGQTFSWASSNNSVATVSSSGRVTAVAVGTANVSATIGSVSGSAAITVTAPPPPPPPGSSPEPGAGDVVMWQDDFNKSTLSELVAPYAKAGTQQLITDGHSGQAIRFPYTAGSWDNLIEKSFNVTTDIYFRYWYRLSPGADPTCGGQGPSGFKWFMPWRVTTTLRYTMGVGNLQGGPSGFTNTGLEFSAHDNTSSSEPNPFMQNINKSKTFKTTADGQWHEYTLHVVTGNGGYEQIWIDGLLVLDNSAYHYDHDPNGIGLIQFPGTMVTWFSGCDFTVDVDDLAIWHK
ncbi:MAG TPA: Ig-like domain-containing protein [Gemmatimonadaceae bacterium]|nr:Ig-like domain-containing protein [Gemmatimonadaceae bacterium]